MSLTNGPLAHLLANRVYLGELTRKGQSYPAEHPAKVFEAVTATLAANRSRGSPDLFGQASARLSYAERRDRLNQSAYTTPVEGGSRPPVMASVRDADGVINFPDSQRGVIHCPTTCSAGSEDRAYSLENG